MNKFLKYSAMGCAALAVAGTANAVPTLTIQNGTSTVTVLDNGTGDLNPAAGVVLFSGAVGNYDINVDTGETMPVLGTSTRPEMDLSFVASINPVSMGGSTSPGVLTITFTDNGFTYSGILHESIGATMDGTGPLTDTVTVDGTPTGSHGSFSTSPIAATGSASVSLGATDVLGLQLTLDEAAGQSITGDFNINVPDGGMTLMLLGSALSSLALLKKKLF